MKLLNSQEMKIILKICNFDFMNTKFNRLIKLLQENFRLFSSISLGVFLFVLFFQPFPLERFDFNNTLLFDAGFGAIIFLIMFLLRVVYPWIIQSGLDSGDETLSPSFLGDFIILALSSVAFAFYLKYVGSVSISFYIIFKVALICLSVPVVLRLKESNKMLIKQNESLIAQKKTLQNEISNYKEDILNKTIEFNSEMGTENLKLHVSDIAFIKSADNYVEIVYKEEENLKKKLIRNTLKNIELQIKQYSYFIRCHRTCIVSTLYIEKLNKGYGNHWLTIKGYSEPISVSRQYLLKIKEVL